MVKIAHLADIHIQDRRREEYEIIFNKLYESLREETPDIIALVGDIFDNKMRASAHNMEDVLSFLTSLSAIAPVVMIAGNHDLNCLIPGSLDLITPLITEHKALQAPNVIYWRHSGVYEAHGILWTVIATDGIRPTIAEEDAMRKEGQLHICLFHEEVNGSKLPNGITLQDFKLTLGGFDRYDLSMGGHIHLRQNFTPNAGYCGSLVQQNIAETHDGHGYVIWEFKDELTYKPVDLYNPQGFVRIVIKNNLVLKNSSMPVRPLYWEIMADSNTSKAIIDVVESEYKTKFGMEPRAIRTTNSEVTSELYSENSACPNLSEAQTASYTIEEHDKIIRTLLFGYTHVEKVVSLHRERWNEPSITTGGKFRLLSFDFDDMYAFGPNNHINFTNFAGCISGVIAANHTGKSSLIESILFALYEDHPRSNTKKDVIHRGATACAMRLKFELDGKVGIIEKQLSNKSHSGESKYRFEYNGENRTRGGTVETLKEIESVIGSADIALSSSFQLQGGEISGFIGLPQSGRKKMLASVMSLGSFETLERQIAKELTAASATVKLLEAQFRGIPLESIKQQLVTDSAKAEAFQAEIDEKGKKLEELMRIQIPPYKEINISEATIDAKIKEFSSEENTDSCVDFAEIESAYHEAKLNLAKAPKPTTEAQLRAKVSSASELLAVIEKNIVASERPKCFGEYASKFSGVYTEKSGDRPTDKEMQSLLHPETNISPEFARIKSMLNPSACHSCAEISKYLGTNISHMDIIERANYWWSRDNEANINRRDRIAIQLKGATDSLCKVMDAAQLHAKMQQAYTQIETIYNKAIVEKNHKIELSKWRQMKEDKQTMKQHADHIELVHQLNIRVNSIHRQHSDILQKVAGLQYAIINETERSKQYDEAVINYSVLKSYRAVLRPSGGIGDYLLNRAREQLEKKINEGLRELGAKFQMLITDDYDVHICNIAFNKITCDESGDSIQLPASLGSGYQKFVLSLATRLAIWRLSIQPRPDAFIIDEGFGVCDDEYLESMASALESLADAPDGPNLVFIVSHVDALKNRLERVLEIAQTPHGSRITDFTSIAPIIMDAAADIATSNVKSDKITVELKKKSKKEKEAKKEEAKKEIILDLPYGFSVADDKIYCIFCKQLLTYNRLTTHCKTAKHDKNVKNAN